MTGWALFRHGFLMLFRNFRMALQISVLPVLIFALVFFLLDLFSDDPSVADRERAPFDSPVGGITDLEPQGILSFLVVFALGLTIAWIGVAWHRYVLLGERSNLPLPKFNPPEIGLYLIAILKLLFLFTILAILTILIMAFAPALGQTELVFSLVSTALLFFTGTILPSAAMGERQRIKDALGAVSGDRASLVVLTLLVVAFNFVLGRFIGLLGDHFFMGAVSVLATWFSVFLHLCILTTLYGFYVEGREL